MLRGFSLMSSDFFCRALLLTGLARLLNFTKYNHTKCRRASAETHTFHIDLAFLIDISIQIMISPYVSIGQSSFFGFSSAARQAFWPSAAKLFGRTFRRFGPGSWLGASVRLIRSRQSLSRSLRSGVTVAA